ncbi:MAG: hypothetical protein HDR54_02920 [Treponema sp.]|nr:hypothetical protein [Treponema sp.]MBD5410981.1 hypothetical protein [Treponema sp.]
MRQYRFEGIPMTIPEDLTEMQGLFSRLLINQRNAVVSFINPEIFLAQQKDDVLYNYFSHTQYNFIDGIGLLRAINRAVGTKYGTENRFPGTDFFSYLPPGRIVRVYLYGSRIEHLEAAKEEIERQFPGVQIVEWTFLL